MNQGVFGRCFLTVLGLVLSAPLLAFAQDEGGAREAPGVIPPALVERVDPVYPDEARAAALETAVVLLLTVDVDGSVIAVEVVEPRGHGFDEAAIDAALLCRFAPARSGGQPVKARVRLSVEFRLGPDATAAPLTGEDRENAAEAPAPAASTTAVPPELPAGTVAAKPPLEVVVQGTPNEAARLRRSAEAVNVVEMRRARRQSVDLAEVLARTQGVGVRRDGGLGSAARFSLNGLYDDQIRIFIDGAPADFGGYAFGIENIPVNLVERVEVYRGVVPIRFGTDALGGAINVVSDQRYTSHAGASYQIGSFGTHRASLAARKKWAGPGLVLGGVVHYDGARNDYPVEVDTADTSGTIVRRNLPRFHDDYRQYGGMVEAGVVAKPWARSLFVRAFASHSQRQYQSNLTMTVPYGEPTSSEGLRGAVARYEVSLRSNLQFETVAGYAHRNVHFTDRGEWIYDWTGKRTRRRMLAGEIGTGPAESITWQDSGYARVGFKWTVAKHHQLSVVTAGNHTRVKSKDVILTELAGRDFISPPSTLSNLVSGLEYQLDLFDDQLSNILFVKDYLYRAKSRQRFPDGSKAEYVRDYHSQGVGDGLKLRLRPWLYAKVSYEYATRLPRSDEAFGDGALVQSPPQISPENSHNFNIGPLVELPQTPIGKLTAEVNVFVRDSDNLILFIGNDRFAHFDNVYHAFGKGVENALTWTTPGRLLSLDGNLTWVDVRNASSQGTFGYYQGARIPNRPYLYANWGAHLHVSNLPGPNDSLEPFYSGRYASGFFRGWEGDGLTQLKQRVDSQVTHSAGITYTFTRDLGRLNATLEVDNLMDAKVFDNFGAQRPGRSFAAKLVGEI